jgi:hypothetical protein
LAEYPVQLTFDRAETKYLVAPGLVPIIAREIARVLPRHEFRGQSTGWTSPRLEFATTIYFDTGERELYREAVAKPVHAKLRARDYYSVGTPATDHARAGHAIAGTALVWLEIKHRDGGRTRKRRAAIARRDLARLFQGDGVSAEALALAERDAAMADLLVEIARIRRLGSASLRPDCVVHYRRAAWQDAAGSLRVTIDREVEFFAATIGTLTRDAWTRHALGRAAGRLDAAVLEIKLRGTLPTWLERVLMRHHLTPERFSKFVAASRAVHG